MPISQSASLDEAEKILELEYESITLIGELAISRFDLIFLQTRLKSYFRSNLIPQRSRVQTIWKRHPLCCLTVTVFIGVYHYDGNLWNHFIKETYCEDTDEWKHWFWTEISKRHMLYFDPDGNRRFVSTILGHAGVPQKSFKGFVDGFIKPAVFYQYTASEAIDMLQEGNSHGLQVHMLHTGVRDYLFNGGKPAEDFVDRCLQVYEGGIEELDRFKGFLPYRILKKFKEYLQEDLLNTPVSHHSVKIQQPIIKISPYLDGISLHIPTQILQQLINTATWELQIGGELKSIPCDVVKLYRSEHSELIPQSKIINLRPETIYALSFYLNGNKIRMWKWNTSEPLLFDNGSRELLKRLTVTEENALLVTKKEYILEDNNYVDVVSESLFDDWLNYQVYGLSSTVNTTLNVTNRVNWFSVHVLVEKKKPNLSQRYISHLWVGNGAAYTNFPIINIPISYDPDLQSHFSQWTLSLKHESGQRWGTTLTDICDTIKVVEDTYEIDFSKYCSLSSVGNYDLRLIGILGLDVRLEFTLLPDITVLGVYKPAFPHEYKGYQDDEYTVDVKGIYYLTVIYPNYINVSLFENNYILYIPKHLSTIRCQLQHKQLHESIIVTLNCKAISWSISKDRSLDNTLLNLSEQTLMSSIPPRILLNTAPLKHLVNDKKINITIGLRQTDGTVLQNVSKLVRVGSEALIDLTAFRDSYRYYNLSKGWLWVYLNGFSSPASFPIACITSDWKIVKSNIILDRETNILKVTWTIDTVVKPRILRFWDEFHPWNGYEEFPIEDNEYSLKLDWGNRQPGSYLFEWSTNDSADIFSFLNEVRYPSSEIHSIRWMIIPPSYMESQLSSIFFSRGTLTSTSRVSITSTDVLQMLQGLEKFGESFLDMQAEHLEHWRSVGTDYNSEIVLAMKAFIQHPMFQFLSWLMGSMEWSVQLLIGIPGEESGVWHQCINNILHINDFGTTQGEIKQFLKKTSDDLFQMKQLISDQLDQDLRFNTRATLLHFLIQYNENLIVKSKVIQLIQSIRPSMRDYLPKLYQEVPGKVRVLLDLRYEENATIPVTYLLIVAVTALVYRLAPRGMATLNEIILARQMDRVIHQLTPDLLIHDAYHFESSLFGQEEEQTNS